MRPDQWERHVIREVTDAGPKGVLFRVLHPLSVGEVFLATDIWRGSVGGFAVAPSASGASLWVEEERRRTQHDPRSPRMGAVLVWDFRDLGPMPQTMSQPPM